MKIIEGFEQAKSVLTRSAPFQQYAQDIEQKVKDIIDEVRSKGDAALLDFSKKFDIVKISSLEVTREQVADAYKKVDQKLVAALKLAEERIRSFHELQKNNIKEVTGKEVWQLLRPLNRVGIYAPGGTASYPSTVLMTAVPAKVAGVNEVILATPPSGEGLPPASTLVASDIAGVNRIFSIGGAQAIAALAFGTESVPRVDKICGPGNIYVALAKKLVYGAVDIDGLQGPSEVLIIADDTSNPEYCASDLIAQAEHDHMASAVLVTTSYRIAEKVVKQVEQQLKDLPRKSIATESLKNKGIIAIVGSMDEAIELSNLYAPEHLCLMFKSCNNYIDKITSAGCVFIGKKSTVAFGDYVAGPSHVLPTEGTARFSSPLNVTDFIKFIDIVNLDKADIWKLGQAAATIARAEGLDAHARAIEKRLS